MALRHLIILPRLIFHPKKLVKILKYKYCNFYFINIRRIRNKKVSFQTGYPWCNQKTYITGIGQVEIGGSCIFGFKPGGFYRKGSIELQTRAVSANLKIGNRVSTNNNIFISATQFIEIGDDTLIGQYVTIMDYEAHGIEPDKRRQMGEIGRVIIGRNVWIGNNVIILKNTEIGENTIVAAGAVVSGKFPANVIIGGVPAKVIKPLPK